MKPIIKVRDLGKQYTLGGKRQSYATFREMVVGALGAPLKIARNPSGEQGNTFWALQDVDFDVFPGDVVGIIGRNGAGKSTLLKILSRITEPTLGRAEIYGRVGSLLEVGTGFHAELTGRENIYLNGAILGMKRSEIARKFDEIVDFSEVEDFLDTPVKRYSSGMYMKLAFAVAANLDPEILVVDEVLSVGDAEFQKKCLGKMRSVSSEGRTVLFVSHNMAAVEALCKRAILLKSGKVEGDGATREMIEAYLNSGYAATEVIFDNPDSADGNENIRIKRLVISPSQISVSDPIDIEFEFWNRTDNKELYLAFDLINSYGITVLSSMSEVDVRKGEVGRATCAIPGHLLNDGTYGIHIFFFTRSMTPLFDQKDICSFAVDDIPRTNAYLGKISGVVRPQLEWRS